MTDRLLFAAALLAFLISFAATLYALCRKDKS